MLVFQFQHFFIVVDLLLVECIFQYGNGALMFLIGRLDPVFVRFLVFLEELLELIDLARLLFGQSCQLSVMLLLLQFHLLFEI